MLAPQVQSSHPNYVRIDNSTGFDEKIKRAVTAVVERVEAAAGVVPPP